MCALSRRVSVPQQVGASAAGAWIAGSNAAGFGRALRSGGPLVQPLCDLVGVAAAMCLIAVPVREDGGQLQADAHQRSATTTGTCSVSPAWALSITDPDDPYRYPCMTRSASAPAAGRLWLRSTASAAWSTSGTRSGQICSQRSRSASSTSSVTGTGRRPPTTATWLVDDVLARSADLEPFPLAGWSMGGPWVARWPGSSRRDTPNG